jgi:hypothetical protein
MAGAGFKTFAVGEVLTANNVNTYLMQQTVMVFASAAARSTALSTNVAEGMVSYLSDTNVLEKYDGAAWVDITADSIAKGLIDAKGDLIVGTADNTPARLGVGTNGQVLTANSGASTGLAWAAAPGGGKVLQVVSATAAPVTTVTSTSFTDAGLSASITPSAATSKVLVITNFDLVISENSSTVIGAGARLVRDSTAVYTYTAPNAMYLGLASANNAVRTLQGLVYVDSPNTTSSTTYKVQVNAWQAGDSVAFGSGNSSIVLIEIGA